MPEKLIGQEKFTVTIDQTGKTFDAGCSEPLLTSFERHGVAIDSLCRSGECGLCRTRLVGGKVFMPALVSLRKTDAVFGYIHPCMSYPVSDIRVRI